MSYFPTSPVLDNFNRIENPLSTGWDVALLGSMQANGLTCQGNNAGFNIQYYGTSFSGDQECFASISVLGGNGDGLYLGLMGKDTGSILALDGYDVVFIVNTGGTDTWALRRITNASPTTLASGSQELSVGDQVGIRLANGVLTVWYNGIQLTSFSDSTYSGVGKIGLSLGNTTWRVDNFGGGNVRLNRFQRLSVLGV